MLIGELSRRTGFSRDTIRFYEKKGFIELGRKQRRDNNYKEYPQEALDTLLIIKQVKQFGFTLQEIRDFLDYIVEGTATCDTVSARMKEKIVVIDEKISGLKEMKRLLVTAMANCTTTEGNCCGLLTNGTI